MDERAVRRRLFLAHQAGKREAAREYARDLARLHGDEDGWGRYYTEVTGKKPRAKGSSAIEPSRKRGGGLAGFYDRNPKACLVTTVAVSTVAGVKLNQRLGGPVALIPVLPNLKLQGSTWNGTGLLLAAAGARHFRLKRTSKLLLAGAIGQGGATIIAHTPMQALMAPRESTPRSF